MICFLTGIILCSHTKVHAQANWTQIGLDIDGETAGDRSGSSVRLNADGTVIAIGATENNGGAPASGQVRVYENIADTWVQLGGDINGIATDDDFGYAVSVNDDGTIVAVGAPKNDAGGIDAGQVRIYELIAGVWTQIGAALNGEAAGDQYGFSINLNGDGSIIAIGANLNDGIGADAGHVRVFENVAGTWVQMGSDIEGEFVGDYCGSAVNINTSGMRVAIGAYKNDGGGPSSGHIRVFEFSGGAWTQLGGDMNGENAGDECGRAVGINGDGTRVIFGAPRNDGNGADAGNARVFEFVGGVWVQLGADLDGPVAGDEYGWSVTISDEGSTVAFGGPKNDGSGAEAGQVRAYEYLLGNWVLKGLPIGGQALYDRWGWSTSINEDGSVLASGAYVNDGNGISAGHARVYRFICDSIDVTISDLELCFGESLTLDGESTIGSPIIWDMGVIDGVPFVPATTGLITYSATTASPNDCPYSVEILVHELPTVTADVDPTEICLGESAIFTGGGALSYSWDNGVTNGVAFTPAAIGTVTYTVTGTDVKGCENTSSVDLTVHPLPVVTASASATEICLGESITFTGGGADTYVWDGGVTDGVAFTPLAAGTITFTVIGTNTTTGCENTAMIDIIVNDTPTVVANASVIELCIGESLIFTGSGADSYVWDLGVMDGVSFTPLAAGIFVHTVTGTITATGCQGIDNISIDVHDLPTVIANVDDSEICLGESLIFTGSGAETYTWDGGVIDGDPFTPVTDGVFTFNVIGVDDNGCENTNSVDITVNPLPVVTANASDTEICLGESLTLTGGGADTYVWDGGVTDGIAFTPISAGTITYTVIGTNTTTGCENTAMIDIIVNDTPTVVANALPLEICLGEAITFTGSGADTYIWDLGVVDGVPFTPAAAGTFVHTVIGTIDLTGCQATDDITVTVYDIPIVTASVDFDEICLGESIILTGGGAVAYTWDGGAVDGVSFTPVSAGTFTFTVIGTNVIGCENTASIDVIVNDLPVVIATATPSEICLGESIVFTGSGADIYSWDGGVVDGVAFTPVIAETRTYTVIGTNATTGCENSDEVEVIIYPNPIVTATATPDEICLGEAIILTGGGADSYIWDAGAVDGVPYTPGTAGVITYTVVGYLGPIFCEASASVTITVHELPIVKAYVNPTEICFGDSAVFTGEGAVSYLWDHDVINEEYYIPLEVGETTYTVIGTSEHGCENTAYVDLMVHELPDLTAKEDTIINTGGIAQLDAFSSHTGDYLWSPYKDVDCETCSSTTADPLATTTFTVYFVDNHGCKAQEDVLVMINYIRGIGVPTAFSPNEDGSNDVLYVKGYNIKSLYFEVYNRYGERVFSSTEQGVGWDGSYKNREENPGVFTWVLFYTLTDGYSGQLQGNTTLIR